MYLKYWTLINIFLLPLWWKWRCWFNTWRSFNFLHKLKKRTSYSIKWKSCSGAHYCFCTGLQTQACCLEWNRWCFLIFISLSFHVSIRSTNMNRTRHKKKRYLKLDYWFRFSFFWTKCGKTERHFQYYRTRHQWYVRTARRYASKRLLKRFQPQTISPNLQLFN